MVGIFIHLLSDAKHLVINWVGKCFSQYLRTKAVGVFLLRRFRPDESLLYSKRVSQTPIFLTIRLLIQMNLSLKDGEWMRGGIWRPVGSLLAPRGLSIATRRAAKCGPGPKNLC